MELFLDISCVEKKATLERIVDDIKRIIAGSDDQQVAEDLGPLMITLSKLIKRSVEDNDQKVPGTLSQYLNFRRYRNQE